MDKITAEKKTRVLIFASLILLALSLRILLLYVESFDITNYEGIWYDTFIKVGRIDAFKEVFYNYSPAFLYLIDITTLFRFIPKEIAIKLISVVFDFVAAFAVMKIVMLKYPQGVMRWIGFFALLFLPTVFVESGMWGQNDIVFTSFILWSFYFILRNKPLPAIFFFAVAFCFKLQAAFFAPIFGILFLRKKFPLWMFFVVPAVFFISVVPAWLSGGPLKQLLLVYFQQFGAYETLAMRSPNLYLFLNDETNLEVKIWIGMIFTGLLTAAYLVMRWRNWKDMGKVSLCYDAVLLTLLIPFFLPKMHERYFFMAGLFMLLLALFDRRLIWAALAVQASSLLSFIPYFSGWSDNFARAGTVINVFMIIGLLLAYREHLTEVDQQLALQLEDSPAP